MAASAGRKRGLSPSESLEREIKRLEQRIYDDPALDSMLGVGGKIALLSGLIMALIPCQGRPAFTADSLHGGDGADDNDGALVLSHARSLLDAHGCPKHGADAIMGVLGKVFSRRELWAPADGGSIIASMCRTVETRIMPPILQGAGGDISGMILTVMSGWNPIEGDRLGDVVLTPIPMAHLMARIARVGAASNVWDPCMGSAGLLKASADIMAEDAAEGSPSGAHGGVSGVEILDSVYMSAVLSMIMSGMDLSRIVYGDSLKKMDSIIGGGWKPDVLIMNPPYSAPGRGLVFAEESLARMGGGYGAVLIQENAGGGRGGDHARRILETSTLKASIRMPADLFAGRATVQTAVYLFQAGRPHRSDDSVTFIDFSVDGYSRGSRRKSLQNVNLKDADHAADRYREVTDICLGRRPATSYYTEGNGNLIRDTISLSGDDWMFSQHRRIIPEPTEEDFMRTVSDYLAWKTSAILKGEIDESSL